MTYRPNLPAAIATIAQPGVIKADGSTITVAADATASVVGTAVTALTDISSGTLGGPALSDVDTLNRAGTDYKVTLSARSALFRKNPAGSRSITLVSGATSAVLTAADNDKQIIVSGTSPGTLSVDGTITDGFRCLVINKAGGSLAYSGISGLGGVSSLATGGATQVYMAASVVEATSVGTTYTLPPATTAVVGGIKPDGVSLTTASDGTLSVITTTTHALAAGSVVNAADEIATYSVASSSDIKYSVAQLSNYAQTNIQNWASTARPTPAAGQYVIGYNTSLARFEFWNGSAWSQHVRVSDLAATASQIFGGSGTSGVAAAVSIGSGLQLSNSTLSCTGVPVSTVATSGSSQALSFPSTGSRAYDVTLTANCAFTISGGTAGELQTVTLIVRGGAGGFSAVLPTNVKWRGGSAPTVDTSAGSINLIRIQTSDGGTTFAGNF